MTRLAALLIWAVLAFVLAGSVYRPHSPAWRTDAVSICKAEVFEGVRYTVCRPNLKMHKLSLTSFDRQGRPLRDFSRLQSFIGTDRSRLAFAMNAGMYDLKGKPIGLYVAAGKTFHSLNLADGVGNFHLKPNGVFWIDGSGAAHVTETTAFAKLAPSGLNLATQSGPMLVIGGLLHPSISPNGSSRYVRNGVGIGADGQPIFVISETPVSFGQLARLFRDKLGCRDALYLDGLVSALWDGPAGLNTQTVNLGPMIVAIEASPLPTGRVIP